MRKSRKILLAAVSTAAAAGIAVPVAATAASAAVASPAVPMAYHRPMPKEVSAGVEITSSGYERYAQVFAIQQRGWKGFVQYTNFSYPGNSNVWAPVNQAGNLTFTVPGGASYTHVLNAGLVLKALSNRNVEFSGTGSYTAPGQSAPEYDWTIQGDVKGDVVTFAITYLDPATQAPTGYTVSSTSGTIAPNGSASGLAKDSNGTVLDWSLPAGSFQTVDHFYARVTSDRIQVRGQDAIVSFAIPKSAPFAGTAITWKMHNGGKPAMDTFTESDNGGAPFSETVEAGHIQMLP